MYLFMYLARKVHKPLAFCVLQHCARKGKVSICQLSPEISSSNKLFNNKCKKRKTYLEIKKLKKH